MNKGALIILSSPSGGGKTTILNAMRARFPDIEYSVSTTTREPRKGEKDGRDYRFLTRDEFMKSAGLGEFAEWARVHGHLYGTPYEFIRKHLDEGRHVMLDIDVQGALELKRKYPEAVLIFITPPSIEALKKRLEDRGADSDESIGRRLAAAKNEISQSSRYDHVVVNDVLAEALNEVGNIIKARTGKRPRR